MYSRFAVWHRLFNLSLVVLLTLLMPSIPVYAYSCSLIYDMEKQYKPQPTVVVFIGVVRGWRPINPVASPFNPVHKIIWPVGVPAEVEVSVSEVLQGPKYQRIFLATYSSLASGLKKDSAYLFIASRRDKRSDVLEWYAVCMGSVWPLNGTEWEQNAIKVIRSRHPQAELVQPHWRFQNKSLATQRDWLNFLILTFVVIFVGLGVRRLAIIFVEK